MVSIVNLYLFVFYHNFFNQCIKENLLIYDRSDTAHHWWKVGLLVNEQLVSHMGKSEIGSLSYDTQKKFLMH